MILELKHMLNFDQEFSISQLITLSFKKEKLIIEFHQFQGYDLQTPLYRFFFFVKHHNFNNQITTFSGIIKYKQKK